MAARDRELAGVDRLAHRLLDSDDEAQIARLLLDELAELFALDLANLALVEDSIARSSLPARAERNTKG